MSISRRSITALLAFLLLAGVYPAQASNSLSVTPAQGSGATPPAIVKTGTAENQDMRLEQIEGEVLLKRQGGQDFEPVQANATVKTGDALKTGQGSCRLVYKNKTDILIGPQSTMHVLEASEDRAKQSFVTSLNLESGTMRAKLSKLKDNLSRFEVSTPTATAVVRGTTLYLTTGLLQGMGFTELYVDETDNGVTLRNHQSDKAVEVAAHCLSKALANGETSEPDALDENEQKDFKDQWDSANQADSALGQFGVEEIPLPGGPGGGAGGSPGSDLGFPENFNDFTDEARQDRVADQQTGTDPVVTTPPVVTPPTNEGPNNPPEVPPDNPPVPDDPPTEGPPTEEPPTEEPPTEEPPTEEPPTEEPPADPLSVQEAQMIRQEIAAIRGDQDFDNADANLAQVSDSQTGKTFTDAHGNRVRVDQYIFQTDIVVQQLGLSSVNLLSLTARTGEYQNGVTSTMFNVIFNRALAPADGPLRELPWNDYLNVVDNTQLTGLGVPPNVGQFIVHEQALSEPGLYPLSFTLAFSNPAGHNVAFLEFFGPPVFTMADQGNFWAQPMFSSGIGIEQLGGDLIASVDVIGAGHAVQINGEPLQFLPADVAEGSQTALFAGDANLGSLDTEAGVNYYRNLPVNQSDDFANHVHPAFFEERFPGGSILIGAFFPISDQGEILDVPGFRIRGIRDVVSPNPLVASGNYNLELLFLYGNGDESNFNEEFRIDAIITPEIFTPFGTNGPNPSFPKAFYPDQDHGS